MHLGFIVSNYVYRDMFGYKAKCTIMFLAIYCPSSYCVKFAVSISHVRTDCFNLRAFIVIFSVHDIEVKQYVCLKHYNYVSCLI